MEPADIAAAVDVALAEDIGRGDLTTRATVPAGARLRAQITAREDMVVAGMPLLREIVDRLAPDAELELLTPDGTSVQSGAVLARMAGPAEGLLTAERTALNSLQFLSGIATLTHAYVREIAGTGATLLDTRKTVPGLRNLSKYAVRCGGGTNHRMRLDDGILIKDNHIAVAGTIGDAVRSAKQHDFGAIRIQAECDTLAQVKEAFEAGADSLLLDNMSLAQLREAVTLINGRIPLEASGGVNLQTIRAIAETGVDFISVGAITQRAPAVDIGLDFTWE
ncbi:MAG: carboxylating nicotinate-nucleotide diphosphorylase [Rhodospirillales bacterium]|nr:carboxylating nicotinate-nucleotide diphosphorylase [Rhodospirillales bacterium]